MANAPHLIERAAAGLAAAGVTQAALVAPPPPLGAACPPVVPRAALERAGLMAGHGRAAEELWLIQRQILRAAFAPPGAEPAGQPDRKSVV